MPPFCYALTLIAMVQSPVEHAANPIFRALIADGFGVNGSKVSLPAPTLSDGLSAEAARSAIRAVAGDDRAVKELFRDSVTAPFVLKIRDVKAGDATVRVADLWFVVRARLEDVDLDRAIRSADGQAVEVANMRVEGRRLAERDLLEQKIELLPPLERRTEWYTHLTSRLLDRIEAEGTDHAVATRSAESLVVASRTDPAFAASGRFPNRWSSLTRMGRALVKGPDRAYLGGANYAKVTRLEHEPGTLFVEAHLAYVEPDAWFQGNPILRSKFGPIAQDQVRRLRRELEKKRDPN